MTTTPHEPAGSLASTTMVERTVLILRVFERSAALLSLGQVAARSGLPRSSVHRILQQLVEARWLERLDTDYRLGLRMFEIGSLVAHRNRVSSASRPLMQELCSSTGHVVHLAILDERDVVYLEKVGGALANQMPSRVGGRLPAHCTGVGKALLAYSPRPVVEEYLAGGLAPRTTSTISSEEEFEAEMARIRGTGYATELGESMPGMACGAAPILEAGNAIAAISVSGPRQHVDVDAMKHRIMWAAAEISRAIASAPRLG
ncbi:IclR family transcriptional regulator [Glaciibacter psychrotolerans]|uniref:DNA-binding IclR family transcriptional regulator n=1 Tax=Glaciibacter psychrotolerans TaxID=670054 RepID=A0A7Z0EGS6_9MICO|nr:IclR family transcriptional regulator [Leifsonia psychrotolerans]NYJ21348.1 DNA-binding IclR family transcriptional regulator [Leifsonia psychrotolerans]